MSKEKVIKVIDIVKEYLKANKLDGLSESVDPMYDNCCCAVEDIGCWCEGMDILNCYPGKKEFLDEVDPNNWIIIPYKKD